MKELFERLAAIEFPSEAIETHFKRLGIVVEKQIVIMADHFNTTMKYAALFPPEYTLEMKEYVYEPMERLVEEQKDAYQNLHNDMIKTSELTMELSKILSDILEEVSK